MFKRFKWGKLFPTHCGFDSVTNLSQDKCAITMETEIRDLAIGSGVLKQIYFKIKIVRESDKKVIEQEFSYPMQPDKMKITLYQTQMGAFLKAAPFALFANLPKENIEGSKSQMVMFNLNLEDRENPEIYQVMFNTKIWYAFEHEYKIENGLRYRTTYGYSTILAEESENVFIENELPFAFSFSPKTKEFINMVLDPEPPK